MMLKKLALLAAGGASALALNACGSRNSDSTLKDDVHPTAQYGYLVLRPSFDIAGKHLANELVASHKTLGGSVHLQFNTPIKVFAGENCLTSIVLDQFSDHVLNTAKLKTPFQVCGINVLENQTVEVPLTGVTFDPSFGETYLYDLGPTISFENCITNDFALCNRGRQTNEFQAHQASFPNIVYAVPPGLQAYTSYFVGNGSTAVADLKQTFQVNASSQIQSLRLTVPELRGTVVVDVEAATLPLVTQSVNSDRDLSRNITDTIVVSMTSTAGTSYYYVKQASASVRALVVPGIASTFNLQVQDMVAPINLVAGGVDHERVPVLNVFDIPGANNTGVYNLVGLDAQGQPDLTTLRWLSPYLATGTSVHVLAGHRYKIAASAKDDQGNFKEVYSQILSE